jgi:hypothetical protein
MRQTVKPGPGAKLLATIGKTIIITVATKKKDTILIVYENL